jgi:hypothetical protein
MGPRWRKTAPEGPAGPIAIKHTGGWRLNLQAGIPTRRWRAHGPRCLLLAQSGHGDHAQRCPLLGVKRTSTGARPMSAFDPFRQSQRVVRCDAQR